MDASYAYPDHTYVHIVDEHGRLQCVFIRVQGRLIPFRLERDVCALNEFIELVVCFIVFNSNTDSNITNGIIYSETGNNLVVVFVINMHNYQSFCRNVPLHFRVQE
jgi:hypothetical protein